MLKTMMIALAVAFAAAGPAAAQAAAPEIEGLGARPAAVTVGKSAAAYNAWLSEIVLTEYDDGYGPCAEGRSLSSKAFTPMQDLVDPKDQMQAHLAKTGGRLWREAVEVTGCGVTTVQNILVGQALREAKMGLVALTALPGETRVSAGVYRNVAAALVAGAAARAKPCPGGQDPRWRVLDTKFTIPPPAADDWETPWAETWRVRFCAAEVELPLRFAPTPAIGGYEVIVRGVDAKKPK